VVGKDVVFEIYSDNRLQVYYRSARTDDDGVAKVELRLPWTDVDPESRWVTGVFLVMLTFPKLSLVTFVLSCLGMW
jgi:hypothetical protein